MQRKDDMNYKLMSPKRQVDQGAAAGAVLGAQCNCLACQRNRCEPSVSSLGLEQAPDKKEARPDGYRLVGETETQRFYKAEAQDPAEPMSPVTAEFKMQHAAMDCLGEGLERLEDRLQAVLSGNSTGWPAPEEPKAVDTPLMLDLRHVSSRLQVMVQRLNELAARVIL